MRATTLSTSTTAAGTKRPRPDTQQQSYQPVASTSKESFTDEIPENQGDSLERRPPHQNDAQDPSLPPVHFQFNITTLSYAFIGMGILNNAPYVIMLAAAKTMAQGGVAIVYVANIVPGLLVKTTLPYWMERVSYEQRLTLTAILMGCAFVMVGIFSYNNDDDNHDSSSTPQQQESSSSSSFSIPILPLIGQLLGVAMLSAQCALGEASLLALAGKLDAHEGRLLTSFSSGTGMAGPLGFLWKILWTEWIGCSLRFTCFLGAGVLATSYQGLFRHLVRPALWMMTDQHHQQHDSYQEEDESEEHELSNNLHHNGDATDKKAPPDVLAPEIPMSTHYQDDPSPRHQNDDTKTTLSQAEDPERNLTLNTMSLPEHTTSTIHNNDDDETKMDIADMTGTERFRLVLSLWPFIIPLFTVYAAEYACEGGVWTAIGFGDDEASRNQFYERSNWLYQAGVFVSRSSGNWFSISLSTLWVLPGIQVVNLMVFYQIATQQWATFLYHPIPLYSLATVTGLLGGAVYVHGYQLVLKRVRPPSHTEFALSAVSMAESLGILVADIMSLFLQACLYEINGFPGAMVKCPG